MNGLFFELKKIVTESLTVFTCDPLSGKSNLSIWGKLCYVGIPLALGSYAVWKRYVLGDELRGSIVPILTLFMALVFQVIYIAGDKFANRVKSKVHESRILTTGTENYAMHQDVKNYLQRFENYTKLFIRQLVLILLTSLLIIVCYILIHLDVRILTIVLSSLIIVLLYIWILLMLKAIVSIYNLLMEDIQEQHGQIK